MYKTIQTTAWACLPREFKEEVKEYYENPSALGVKGTLLLENLFGIDNLTSDAKGEEMLTVSRKRVQAYFRSHCEEISRENVSSSDKDCYEYANEVLKTLFGSKCLPDEGTDCTPVDKPEPTEPKFKVDDEVVWDKKIIAYVDEILNDGDYIIYSRLGNRYTVHESDLEPYTEPESNCSEKLNSSDHFAGVSKMVDHFRGVTKMTDDIIKGWE